MLGKARRSFAVSIGILLLGFMAIGIAIVYRVMREAVEVPAGSEVVSAVISDGLVNVTYRMGGETMLALFARGTGELVQQMRIGVD